ncbi:ATP dependent DNA ligase [Actinopolyspora mortivallis]|uniref:DNA ligase (ATP) n=1 Tax=Actinopolyspora mortivallis TaxID=33906 RepID=A0A2T0GY39_ACTMO|nr:hypothetical protein [Actinopolyspora mortivallis]PRW64029.1 hypothetical protein CEP50_07500 [Actinopolyspora mortivallis]
MYCYLFDVPYVAGYDLTSMALLERKRMLARTTRFTDPLRWTPYENGRGTRYHRRSCEAGWEGTLAEGATAAYLHDRSRNWLKFTCVATQELVIGGFTEPTGSRPALGALLVGYHERGRLVYAGKVGTGFDQHSLRGLRERLDRLERRDGPFAEEPEANEVRWVEPRLVVSVAFTEWTEDGKLRHPSYQGLREDKDPADVVREVG